MRIHAIHKQRPFATGVKSNGQLEPQTTVTRYNGSMAERYQCYLTCANDGKGGDITRGGAPLKTFDEWLGS